jgi:hypothetical protein
MLAFTFQYIGRTLILYNWILLSMHLFWILFKVIGAQLEGIRIAQLINGFIFSTWTLYFMSAVSFLSNENKFDPFTKTNSILSALVVIFWLHNVIYTQILGATDFSTLKFDGPYKVGVRYFHSRTTDTETMVFYPIDKDEYERKLATHNATWLRRPEKWIAA